MDEVEMYFAGVTTVLSQQISSYLQATRFINLMCVILVHFET